MTKAAGKAAIKLGTESAHEWLHDYFGGSHSPRSLDHGLIVKTIMAMAPSNREEEVRLAVEEAFLAEKNHWVSRGSKGFK